MADRTADPVIDGIAGNCSDDEQRHQHPDIHCARCTKCTADKKQRVARQERQHYQSGFAKHDGKQHYIHQRAILRDHGSEILVDMQNHVEELHKVHIYPWFGRNHTPSIQ